MHVHPIINQTVKEVLHADTTNYHNKLKEYREYLTPEGTFIGNKNSSAFNKNGYGVMLYK
jgi:hypothetical protein